MSPVEPPVPTGPEPDEKLADFLSAEKFRSESRYGEAIDLFKKILEKDPEEKGVRLVLADLQSKGGDDAGALENYYLVGSAHAAEGARGRVDEVLVRMDRIDPERKSIVHKKLRRMVGAEVSRPTAMPDHPILSSGDEVGVSISLSAPLFRNLDPQARARLIERMAVLNVREKSIIFREGDPGTSLYIIGRGRVVLTFRARDEEGDLRDRLFAELGPGQFFGEFAFLTGTSRQFTARVEEGGRIFQLSRASLDALEASYPSLAETISLFYRERVLDRVLAGSTLFGDLRPHQRKELADQFQVEAHPSGSVIIPEGSTGDLLYLIRKGDVQVSATGPRGEEVFLTNLHANDFFGEFSFLTGKPRSATVTATSEAELLVISRDALQRVLDRHPSVLDVMKKAYFERMADNLHKLASSS